MALLATIATGLLWAVPLPGSEALAEELSQLAQALRQDPTPQNYRALARFAEESPQGELSAQAAFALGMAEFEAGRWTQARERFRAARASRRLRDFAALQRARAELELGLWEAAGETLQPLLSPGNPLRDTARVLEVRRLVGAGRAREAVEWLAAQPEVHHRPALLRALAEAQRAAGESVAAAETLHRIYYEFPLSREAGPSNELLAELRAELRSDYPAPSEALRRLRAERLWARGAYHGARSAYLDLSVRAPEPARTEARLRAAEALYRLGSRRVACRELRSVSQVTPALEAEFRAFRVRCALRGGRYWEVEEELALLAAQFRGSRWYQEALQVAGRTTWAQGEMGRARQYYQQLVEAFPNGEAAAEAHWKLAWLSYRTREAAATRILEEHLQHFPHSPFVPRALYWRAQTARAAGARSVAERLLTALRSYAPRDYLAQQAESLLPHLRAGRPAEVSWQPWLERLLPGSESGAPPAPELAPAVQAEVEKASALERLGFVELAAEVLESAARKWPHPELHLARARLVFAQEHYARATEILRRAYPGYWRYRLGALPREAWEVLFPRPYWSLIEREARRQGIDPLLVAALIRQESRFERDAVSSAGALGLMQLMPPTARHLARSRRLSRERILEPELNVRLGTRFLAELLEQFEGRVEMAVAAYNAGGRRVEEWEARDDYREMAEFVEDIPVTQTREFVYIVLRNYRFYRDLYGEPERRTAQE